MDVGPAHAGQPPDEQSGKEGREQHSCSRQNNAGGKDGLYLRKLGVHATGEQNDAECNHADELCLFGIMELQSQSVTAEQHADDKKKQ